jgi:hypothetical protein
VANICAPVLSAMTAAICAIGSGGVSLRSEGGNH